MLDKGKLVSIKNQSLSGKPIVSFSGKPIVEGNAKLVKRNDACHDGSENWEVEFEDEPGVLYDRWVSPGDLII